ncbi:MAG TPA: Ig-like domain repeat protein [Solirubrobacterales bacterium]|nr:Ig-like domain repeat protein [Solirubrobacterales bacterium]
MPIAVACLGLLPLGAEGASAATRFAAPGGTGPAPACTEAAPCSLFNAADSAAPQRPPAGTQIILLAGTYTDANNSQDLGLNRTISLPNDVTVRGAAGEPRPVIAASLSGGEPLTVHDGDIVSHIEIQASTPLGINLHGGTVEDIIVRNSRNDGFACRTSGNSTILRESACLTSGARGVAIGTDVGAGLSERIVLRSVTAISTGPSSLGLSFRSTGSPLAVDAKAMIARGTDKDVRAIGSAAGGSSTINLANSDYAIFEAKGEGGGTASVTEPSVNGNVTAPPLLAADLIHELPGSPTIDKGVLDAQSGITDIDGDARESGMAPDIGADEQILAPTSAAVQCPPAEVLGNQVVTCSVQVKDTGQPNPSVPTGAVGLHSDHRGAGPVPCTLVPVSGVPDESRCQLAFTPTEVGLHRITAAYEGDRTHGSSSGSTSVTVTPRASTTSLACAPAALTLGAGPATCTATVSDPGAAPSVPSGTVRFSTSGAAGTFGGDASCTLAGAGEAKASCQIIFTPAASGASSLRAAYQGDDSLHRPSEGTSPLSVSTQSKSVPETTIKRKPRAKTTSRLAVFSFSADQGGAGFQCKLDKAQFKPCRSPFKRKVKPGRHSFRVRAVDAAGAADPTPASYRWRVFG